MKVKNLVINGKFFKVPCICQPTAWQTLYFPFSTHDINLNTDS